MSSQQRLKLDDQQSHQGVIMQIVMTTEPVVKHLQDISHKLNSHLTSKRRKNIN